MSVLVKNAWENLPEDVRIQQSSDCFRLLCVYGIVREVAEIVKVAGKFLDAYSDYKLTITTNTQSVKQVN